MNEIVKIYKNSPIRIVEKDGEPWFVAKDVCNILEIKNSRDTLNKCLDEDERGVDIIYTPWRQSGNDDCQRGWPLFPDSPKPETGSQSIQALGNA